MSNTLNYLLNFTTNADKVSALVSSLDKNVNGVNNKVTQFGKNFTGALDKINSKLNTIQLNSFIQNVQSAAQGLDSLSSPGLKLNSSLLDLSAITDVTGDKLKEIENYARESAKTFGGDAAQGVESYKLILSQLTPEIANVPTALKEMGNNVSVLSKTMGGDTTAATEVLTTAMNQYQVSTANPIEASKEMAVMMNIMAAAAKEGSAELPQQKAALEQSGMAAKSAKLQFQEHAAAIQVLDKAGKKGSEGGVALRNTLATLSQGRFLPKDVQKELKAAGVDINVLSDKSISFTERLKPLRKIMGDSALLTKLFGKENNNAALALINSIDEQERLTKAITGTNTAFDQASIVMETQAEKNARLKARVDDFKISLFNATGGGLGYAQVLGGIAFDISNLLPLFSGFGKVLGFVTSATKMQALWTGIVSGATSIWTGAQWLLNVALTANPIGIVIVAIGALIAAIAWVVTKTEGWGKAWDHVVKGAKLIFQTFGQNVKLQFLTVVNGIMIGINKIKEGWYKFKMAVGIGDKSENQRILSQINRDTEARKKAIIDQAKKVMETANKAKDQFVSATGSIKWKTESENKESSSISPSTIPGTTLGMNSVVRQTKNSQQRKSNSAIATGGTKHNYVNLSFSAPLIGQVDIKARDFKDSVNQMEEKLADAMLRVLSTASTANG